MYGQNRYSIMNYNLLNYPGNDTTTRNPYFRTTIAATLPDILVCQEMTSQAGVNGFLNNVLIPNYSNYTAGIFIDGPDSDNEIFYKSDEFTFISNTPISTDLRNISEFKLVENSSEDTIRIYSVHLKASAGTSNEQQRLAEVNTLRNVTDNLIHGSYYLVMGDFNFYGSTESAYMALLDQTNPGYFIDIFSMPGTWNNGSYSQYHTQSTRTRQFGGGANGGLDDRFDLILMSPAIIDSGGIDYVPGSYIPFGNDGQHYNDSINQPPNLALSQEVANALHYSSDHLPVIAEFTFGSAVPVELKSFIAVSEGNNIQLRWSTSTETNNRGFEIERRKVKQAVNNDYWKMIGYRAGHGTTTVARDYSFDDINISTGKYQYRLKQIDFDGSTKYSQTIYASVTWSRDICTESELS